MHELLGKHKPSAEWYTPDDIWQRVNNTLEKPYDPCPVNGSNGLEVDWSKQGRNIYVNPPTPASPWAIKAIQTHLEHPEVNIIFACFSEAVLWQVNQLQDFPVCWVRNRIRWIDGRTGEVSKAPRNYNAFVCLSEEVISRFKVNFSDLGTVRKSYVI